MTIQHHPDIATLMSYAAGTLGEALGAVVASHLDLCRECRRETKRMAAIGGALIEVEAVAPLSPEAESRAEAARQNAAIATGSPAGARVLVAGLPRPLARRLGMPLADVAWKRLAPGAKYFPLPLSAGIEGDLRLLLIAPGVKMPEHGHGGTELTLVLKGSYRDEFGHYRAGDVEDVDSEAEHRPVIDSEAPCICLIASESKARFKGIVSRLMQPLTGM